MKKKTITVLWIVIFIIAVLFAVVRIATAQTEEENPEQTGGVQTADTNASRTQEETQEQSTNDDQQIASSEQIEMITVQLDDAQSSDYERLQRMIDEGDRDAFAERLLSGEISYETFHNLIVEDAQATGHILVDVLTKLSGENRLEDIVFLRQNGFVSDECFLDYWEVMGYTIADQLRTDVDGYLLNELVQAFKRDSYALRALKQMRADAVTDDAMHAALIEALGFDYTDEEYVEENEIAPLRELTIEEKKAYDDVLSAIDQGEGMQIINAMLRGEISTRVYEQLMLDDAEVMDYIIAEGMTNLVENGQQVQMFHLRLEGYVSDTCFHNYWQMIGSEPYEGGSSDPEDPGVDLYLIYEMRLIADYGTFGIDMLRDIWNSGILNDATQERLIRELGFDYTSSYGAA